MRRFTISVLLAAMFVLTPGQAFAQGAGDLELNLFFGGSWHSTNKYEIGFPQAVTPIQQEFKFNQGFRGGARFNVFNSGHWGEEFVYSFETNDARFITINPAGSELELGTQIHQFAVNTLYYFDANEDLTVRPFLSFGIGGTLYRPTDEAKSIASDPLRGNLPGFGESTSFAFNYGFGLKARMAGRMGLRFDFKGFLARTPAFGLARQSDDPNATVFPAGGAFHNVSATAGVVFFLN